MTKPAQNRASARVPAARKTVRQKAAPAPKRVNKTSPLMALHEGIVYGPIKSRRLGRSLGINLTPANQKLCSFNCTYCQYGWTRQERGTAGVAETWPSPIAVARTVRAAIKGLASHGEAVDRLTLAGHGEPTMHPQFAEVVAELCKMRDEVVPGIPVAVLSNASTLDRAGVCDALMRVDERYMKLDAGDATTLRTVNGSTQDFGAIVDGLSQMKDIVVQAMFVKDRAGRIDNTTEMAVINWVIALQRIRPSSVHIYTIDRAPAWPYLQPVPTPRLFEIAQRVRTAGIACEIFTRPERPVAPA